MQMSMQNLLTQVVRLECTIEAAMTSTQIANSALAKLSVSPIETLDDEVKSARVIKLRMSFCRDAVIRMAPWKFATTRIRVPTPDGLTGNFGYRNYFDLPEDSLRVLEVNESQSDYQLESNRIIINEGELRLRYLYQADVSKFDAMAVQALSLYIAWDCCYWLSQSMALRNQLWNSFIRIIKRARFDDSTQNPQLLFEADDWVDARLGPTQGQLVRDPLT